jgi:pimeloyl-ACP methyl ester carboxylesterase
VPGRPAGDSPVFYTRLTPARIPKDPQRRNIMERLDIHGTSLAYLQRGDGQPVVLVHGSASDYRTWRGQWEVFGAHYRTIAYSRRYHWPNEPIGEGADYSMAEHVAELSRLVEVLDAAPAHLVGHSYGAFVCLLLALDYPGRVRSLVLAEPPVVPLLVGNPPTSRQIVRLLLGRPAAFVALLRFSLLGMGPAASAFRRGDCDAAMRHLGKAVLGGRAYRRLSDARRAQVRVNLIAAELLGSGFPLLEQARLRQLHVPTLLLRARESPPVFYHLLNRLEQLLPCTSRKEIAGASHMMHEDNVTSFNEAVLSFLEAPQ